MRYGDKSFRNCAMSAVRGQRTRMPRRGRRAPSLSAPIVCSVSAANLCSSDLRATVALRPVWRNSLTLLEHLRGVHRNSFRNHGRSALTAAGIHASGPYGVPSAHAVSSAGMRSAGSDTKMQTMTGPLAGKRT